MPTPAVYKKFDDLKLGSNDNVQNHPDWNHWTTLPATELLPQLINDLEPPAFALRPDLADLRSKIESQISRPVRMSGSGSSLFTLADDLPEAQSLADSIRKTGLRADPYQLCPHHNDPHCQILCVLKNHPQKIPRFLENRYKTYTFWTCI